MADFADEIFGADGALAREFAGYSPRAGQIQGARAAKRAIDSDGVLALEAPTGTGKSILYLTAVISSLIEKKGSESNTAIVVTSNIALQEQLIGKDLPLLQKIFATRGFYLTFAIAKGFQNYACKAMVDVAREDMSRGARLPMLQDHIQLERVLNWEKETKAGDFSELPFEMAWEVKKAVSIPSDECAGKRCLHYDACYPRIARKAWKGVHVIVTNYALYMIDLVAKKGGARGPLPQHRIAVFDEAHAMPDAARSHFARRLTFHSARALLADLDASGKRAEKLQLPKGIDPELKVRATREAESFFQELAKVRANKSLYRSRLDVAGMFDGSKCESAMKLASDAYLKAAQQTRLLPEAREALANRSIKCSEAATLIAECRGISQDGWVYYIDESGRGRVELVAEPACAGPFLQRTLFAEDGEPPHAIVMTSATLAGEVDKRTGQPDFGFFQHESGCGRRDGKGAPIAETLAVESPFDFSRTTLVIPEGMPDPSKKRDDFTTAVSSQLVRFVQQVDGGVLALFTSYAGLDTAYSKLMNAGPFMGPDGKPRSILRQKDAPRTQLVDRMRREPGTILLGTDSFWEGVDVQGEALVGLFIDKLPFRNGSDPVLDARKQEDPRGWFGSYYLPDAVLKLKQGFGRLVRTVNDYGVVMICDPRMVTSGYGRAFRGALPKATRFSNDPTAVRAILEKTRAARSAA